MVCRTSRLHLPLLRLGRASAHHRFSHPALSASFKCMWNSKKTYAAQNTSHRSFYTRYIFEELRHPQPAVSLIEPSSISTHGTADVRARAQIRTAPRRPILPNRSRFCPQHARPRAFLRQRRTGTAHVRRAQTPSCQLQRRRRLPARDEAARKCCRFANCTARLFSFLNRKSFLVAALPGIVGASIGLPDVHAGYGFAIGNVAAFDMYVPLVLLPHGLSTNPPPPHMSNPESIVSPGGVGFDINCGVRHEFTTETIPT
jgi:hypothetical protein